MTNSPVSTAFICLAMALHASVTARSILFFSPSENES